MTDQSELDLNGEAYARNSDPGTSWAAAKAVEGELANRLESMVLVALRKHPEGLTNHQLVSETNVDWNTITPRVRPLVRKGFVQDSGERRIGPTNKKCIVWKLT